MSHRVESAGPLRRTGDAAPIAGAYQHEALTNGPPVQRFWHTAKLRLLDWMFPVAPGDHVLDVGCGSGVFSDAMAGRGAHVLGIDANADAITYAQKTFQRPTLTFRRGLLDELDLPAESFDKASCLEVIEHVYEDQVRKLLDDLLRILRPGGLLFLTTPNYRGLWPAVEWAADRFSPVAKMDAEQHVTHFRHQTLRQVVETSGFDLQDVRTYCTFAPFAAAVSWRAADRLERFERRWNLPFGNLLAAVARKR